MPFSTGYAFVIFVFAGTAVRILQKPALFRSMRWDDVSELRPSTGLLCMPHIRDSQPSAREHHGGRMSDSTPSFPFPLCHYSVGVPGCTLVSVNRFSTLCGWLVQRQGWRMKGEYDRVSKRDRLWLTPDLTNRDLWRSMRWARERGNFVSSSLWDFKSSFTCRKILRHGTFLLYFPSGRKVCCGFLSPLKIHRLFRVLNPQSLGPVSSALTTTPPRRRIVLLNTSCL
jgi:hypothetical protein